jgi:hypothetical protein
MKGMVDVCGGKMKIGEVIQEIYNYMLKSPKRLVVDIKRRKKGYYTKIYIPQSDFDKKC